MREKADSDLVRRQNRLLLLEALRQHGAMARVEMGRHTGLSPASITSISSQLIADGILEEASTIHPPAEGHQRRGRLAIVLQEPCPVEDGRSDDQPGAHFGISFTAPGQRNRSSGTGAFTATRVQRTMLAFTPL